MLADFSHTRVCKPFCENSLTLPGFHLGGQPLNANERQDFWEKAEEQRQDAKEPPREEKPQPAEQAPAPQATSVSASPPRQEEGSPRVGSNIRDVLPEHGYGLCDLELGGLEMGSGSPEPPTLQTSPYGGFDLSETDADQVGSCKDRATDEGQR